MIHIQLPPSYPIPKKISRIKEEFKRSRFITTIHFTPTRKDVKAFVDRVRDEFPTADHNCWAFLVGPPGSWDNVGRSDDGEPRGTAGDPILNVLYHSGIGDLAAVVSRFFGGVKLGKGGLIRAYSGGVKHALEGIELIQKVARITLQVVIGYAYLALLHRLILEHTAEIESEVYGSNIRFCLNLPRECVKSFNTALNGLTKGEARVEIFVCT